MKETEKENARNKYDINEITGMIKMVISVGETTRNTKTCTDVWPYILYLVQTSDICLYLHI